MRTNLLLCAIFALSTLLYGCEDNRSADFCDLVCDCADGIDPLSCATQCTTQLDTIEASNAGAPIVSDECFACVNHTSCELIEASCTGACQSFVDAMNDQTNPPVP